MFSMKRITPRRISNFLKYGVSEKGRKRKRAAKQQRREKKFMSGRWQHGDNDITHRNYTSYDEYLEHQGAKLDKIIERLHKTEQEDYDDFKDRFEHCKSLQQARSVLCLGARIGTEVQALHGLGYFAVGIDLNPGAENRYVLPGDFHQIVFPDASIDAIYTNVMDHVYDIEKILAEVDRLLPAEGLFITDLLQGFDEGFIPGEYEATHWRTTDGFISKLCAISGFRVIEDREIGKRRNNSWRQVVFQKS